jgi:hypothetical protein
VSTEPDAGRSAAVSSGDPAINVPFERRKLLELRVVVKIAEENNDVSGNWSRLELKAPGPISPRKIWLDLPSEAVNAIELPRNVNESRTGKSGASAESPVRFKILKTLIPGVIPAGIKLSKEMTPTSIVSANEFRGTSKTATTTPTTITHCFRPIDTPFPLFVLTSTCGMRRENWRQISA